MEEPASKRQKVIADNQPIVMMICNEVVVIIKDNTQKKSLARKEAATEAKVRAAQESTMVPLKIRMLQLRRMFQEKQLSASFSWKKELSKFLLDPRHLVLTSKAWNTVPDKHLQELADDKKELKKPKAKERRDNFELLCEEAELVPKSSPSKLSR